MIPVLLRLGPITIYSYGLMMALGFIAGDLVLRRECRRRGFSPIWPTRNVVWGAIAGIAGSRIYDVFDNWAAYQDQSFGRLFFRVRASSGTAALSAESSRPGCRAAITRFRF